MNEGDDEVIPQDAVKEVAAKSSLKAIPSSSSEIQAVTAERVPHGEYLGMRGNQQC